VRPQSIGQLALIAALSGGVGALVSAIIVGSGGTPVVVTPYLAVAFLVLALALLYAGLAVRRMRARKHTWMTPIAAMRTAVAARSASLGGSAFLGLLAGVAAIGLTRLEADSMVSSAATAGLGALASLVLVVIGVLVERWCVLGPDDDQDEDSSRGDHASRTPA